jgi:hypothetical protein
MDMLKPGCLFSIIHRKLHPENFLEVSFCTMNSGPDYFLWVILDIKHLDEFTEGLAIRK